MSAAVLPAAGQESIDEVARVLREGGVAVIPTDTVYGLAANVLDEAAIERVFRVKGRSPDAAVPVLLPTAADLPLLVREVPAVAWRLIDRFWPGGLTLVLPARPSVSPVITAGGRTVAVRVPGARSCLALLEAVGLPLVGTSANVSGQPAALTAAAASAALGDAVDAILEDDGAVVGNVPSTVVELVDGEALVRRVGAVAPDAIRQALGSRVEVMRRLTGPTSER